MISGLGSITALRRRILSRKNNQLWMSRYVLIGYRDTFLCGVLYVRLETFFCFYLEDVLVVLIEI